MAGNWEQIALVTKPSLTITYPWHYLCEIEGDWTRLRLTAHGRWNCLGDYFTPCGPEGYLGLSLATDRLFVPESAPGALLGKFGGSLAHRSDGAVFVIGPQCIIAMPEKTPTILSIAVNGA